MKKNGKKSCTGKSRHIDIRYFFAKDRVESKNILISQYSTENMLTYFFTKYLQGSLFVKFCDMIMVLKNLDTLHMGPQ